MSGGVPDVLRAGRRDDVVHRASVGQEQRMPFIQVKVIKGVFTPLQRQEIVERLTEAMVAIEGENLRQVTWCVVEEVASGDWGIGGQIVTADDLKALARD
jgi:4-oxalocrotonate tautomerase